MSEQVDTDVWSIAGAFGEQHYDGGAGFGDDDDDYSGYDDGGHAELSFDDLADAAASGQADMPGMHADHPQACDVLTSPNLPGWPCGSIHT